MDEIEITKPVSEDDLVTFIKTCKKIGDILIFDEPRRVLKVGDKLMNLKVALFKLCEKSPLYIKIYNPNLAKSYFRFEELSIDRKKFLVDLLNKKILPVWYKEDKNENI